LLTLLNKVIAGLTANALKFPTPGTAVSVLQAEVIPLQTAIAAAKGGGIIATANLHKEAVKVHGLLKAGLPYVNLISAGDDSIILLSGYDKSLDKEPAAIPNIPVVSKIIEGPIHGSIKIELAINHSPLLVKKVKRTLIVEMKPTGTDDTNYKIVLLTGSGKKLIVPNMTKGVEQDFCVSAMNAKGTSKRSNVVSYIPQTGAAPIVPPTPTPTPTPTTGTTPPATA
jgi:hypothetical protein